MPAWGPFPYCARDVAIARPKACANHAFEETSMNLFGLTARRKGLAAAICTLLLASQLAACGGGGNDAAAPTPPPTGDGPPPPPVGDGPPPPTGDNPPPPTGGGGPSEPPAPTKVSLRLEGKVTDEPIANAAVTARVGDEEFSATADATGAYSIAIEIDEADQNAFITLTARGVGEQS